MDDLNNDADPRDITPDAVGAQIVLLVGLMLAVVCLAGGGLDLALHLI